MQTSRSQHSRSSGLPEEIIDLSSATTTQGSDVNIKVAGGSVMIDEAIVTATDIETSNGVIYVIDTVLLPTS